MSEKVRVLHTDEIRKIWFGRPTGHRHFRLAMQLADGEILVFPEAPVAALVRAYVDVKTHPTRRAVELEAREAQNRKKDFAAIQLLETDRDEGEIQTFLSDLLAAAEASHDEAV
ncbi:MAG: hypothetical protein GXO73_12395 [Calditrichaeota bacterium]|nr:hypothetical protein [Calditrichota bacterium]